MDYIYGKLNITPVSITLEGIPLKTTYKVGEVFSPEGISVYCNYNNGIKILIDNSKCEWINANTFGKELTIGTTSIICRYLRKKKTYSPIVVVE